ncbi:MAG TPA: hypothetical protein VGN94_11845 [Methylobacterium sp.]|nr:hypothetical protein [Methylobacterium sp.]
MLALGIVASGLRRVERALGARREPEADRAPAPRDFGSPPTGAAPVFPSRVDPVLPQGAGAAPATGRPVLGKGAGLAAGGLAGGLAVGAGLSSGRTGSEPTFTDTFFPHRDAPAEPAAEDEPTDHHRAAVEPELPLPEPAGFMPAPPPVAVPPASMPSLSAPAEPAFHPEPDDGIAPEDDLFAAPEPVRPPAEEPETAPLLRPTLDAAPDPEPAAEPEPAPEPAPDAAPAEPEPETEPKLEVVGTYASGGNTYVMFSNGAIEAETPRGRFTFASLDELKAFVEAGGETDARGAA